MHQSIHIETGIMTAFFLLNVYFVKFLVKQWTFVALYFFEIKVSALVFVWLVSSQVDLLCLPLFCFLSIVCQAFVNFVRALFAVASVTIMFLISLC